MGYFLIGFLGMELFSWFVHKYIMHKWLWSIHKTHHTHTKGFLELNDVFSLIFGSTAVVLILLGVEQFDLRFWIGCGITAYGFTYFILHDIMIHRRLKKPRRPSHWYIDGITQAHRDHHKNPERDYAVSFGLLLVPRKYFRKKAKN
ncbi:MAG: sterol desaturase family protein [Cyclobacteriaceae bacterium]